MSQQYGRAQDPEKSLKVKEKVRSLVRETLEDLVENVSPSGLERAAEASNGIEALITALSEISSEGTPSNRLTAARLRGLRARNRLLEARGGTLRSSEVGEILGLTRQAVHQRYKAGKLLGLETGRHGLAYPVWQFDEGGVVPGLEETLSALGDASPWMQARFLLSRNVRLEDQAPIDALREGRTAEVLDAAAAHGEHGAD